MRFHRWVGAIGPLGCAAVLACSNAPTSPRGPDRPSDATGGETDRLADVTATSVSGRPGAYTFSVTIRSPDTGCSSYADWWEVVTEQGDLLYRRILAHSHVDEQPFTRSGGPVSVAEQTRVVVRAHMNPGGFGGQAYAGTPAGGFLPTDLGADFAAHLERAEPLPTGCAF